jgi:alpha-galactosidase
MSHFHHAISRLACTVFSFFLFVAVAPAPVGALENGLARTPPMGWNSWNVFRGNPTETLIKEMADKFVSTGLADAGYKYICIDNGWYNAPNASSYNTTRFPNGIKPVADYVHGKGLKLGIYTCWDSRYNETRDTKAWASWGVDYVKHDSWKQYSTDTAIWTTMRDAILATGRPMVYSVHFQDRATVIGKPTWMNMWRFTNDLVAWYDRSTLPSNLGWGVTTVDIINAMPRVASHTGPGCWADADMLMVGVQDKDRNGPLQTLDEWKTSFAISCILPSPLIISADIRSASQAIIDIFLNKELIAVNQDTLARSWKVRDDGLREVWARRLGDSSLAVVFFNMDAAASMQVGWVELKDVNGKALVRDLWLKQNAGTFTNGYSATVPTHGTAFLKITPERFLTQISTDRPQTRTLLPGVVVRPGRGVILVSLKDFSVAPLTVRCALSTLSGKKIISREWTLKPGSGSGNSLKIPSNCRAGMYVVSLTADNSALKIHREIQTKVFIKD